MTRSKRIVTPDLVLLAYNATIPPGRGFGLPTNAAPRAKMKERIENLAERREKLDYFDRTVAIIGVGLLQLQAKASDPQSQPSWINRRVEQIEFLDTRAVRRQVSIDFVVPENAPSVQVLNEKFQLVPIHSLPKTNLVAFNLRDEQSSAVWMPTSQETTHRLVSALVNWASQNLKINPQKLPLTLITDLKRIVSEEPRELRSSPPAPLAAAVLIDANRGYRRAAQKLKQAREQLEGTRLGQLRRRYAPGRQVEHARRELATATQTRQDAEQKWRDVNEEVRPLAYRLMASPSFRKTIDELAQNFVVSVGTKNLPGTRRIIKLAYDSHALFAKPKGRLRKLMQSLGWRSWQFDVLIGGRGGSYHLEVAAPPGVDVIGITADPLPARQAATETRWRRLSAAVRPFTTKAWWRRLIFWEPDAAISVPGYSPHVHINPPDGASVRYRAKIFVRVSRPGWLSSSWLVAFVIGIVIGLGRFNLPAIYSKGPSAEAGTAATLLLALLAVFATILVRPGEHPLASRLLRLARSLIVIDAAVVLVGVGNLVLHQAQRPPVVLWTWLAILAGTVTILLTISRLLPVARQPHRE